MAPILRQVQTCLDHRNAFGPRPEGTGATLFPPAGTFEALGGRAAVARFVDGLYDRIERDTVLRPAFNRDLTRERERQKLFLRRGSAVRQRTSMQSGRWGSRQRTPRSRSASAWRSGGWAIALTPSLPW